MPDKTSRAIMRLLEKPGLKWIRVYRCGSMLHVEGVSKVEGVLSRGVAVECGNHLHNELIRAIDCLADQTWDGASPPEQSVVDTTYQVGSNPPDQVAEPEAAEVQPMVWVGVRTNVKHWCWDLGRLSGSWTLITKEELFSGEIFVPGHLPKPTINPSEMSTIETCKEVWNA